MDCNVKNKLLKQYNIVFDVNGETKRCGRDACVALISLCELYSNQKNMFGSISTGMMNVKNIQKLIEKIEK